MSRVCPDSKANIAQVLTLSWLTPLLRLGARRPLEEQDLWELDEARHADRLGNRLETLFYERAPPFKRPSEGLRRVTEEHGVGDGLARSTIEGSTDGLTPANKTKYDMSLILAIYHAFAFRIWWTGLLLLVPGALNITTPLVTKLLIQYVTDAFNARGTPSESELKPASYGYGLAAAVFAMQQVASICHNQSYYGTLIFGFLLRTSLIPVVFRKALRLSGRARAEHTAGQITTIISADITRLDNASGFIHVLWYSPLLIIVGIALLIVNIGPSALVGLATLVASIPIQGYFVGKMMNLRRSNVQSTDRRVRLLQEVLQGMRVLVLFNWQTHYMERIMGMRKAELTNIRKLSIMRGLVTATTTFMPILAAILTFITYSLTGHDLDPATIFSSLQLFNVITTPLTLFPLAAAAISDGVVSLRRIRNLLLAEDIAEIPGLDDGDAPSAGTQPAKVAITAISVHGSFTWERAAPTSDSAPNAAKSAAESEKEYARLIARWAVGENADKYSESSNLEGPPPFALENIALDIKPGSFVAVFGRVGSGKSSLLQAVIGEMRRTAGRVEVDGKISYSPQSPWIQNATLRDNILFGQPYDEQRYADVVRSCALEHDIASFPQGDATEIGERGVNLSGGQKARVSLARAAYQQPDIILLDDPLSAVDARVSKHIVDEYLQKGPMASKTRILVTHNLQVLPLADEIICMDKGCVVERGTFAELLERQGAFARMIEEFGSAESRAGALDSLVHDTNESLADPQKAVGLQAPDAQKRFAGDERNVGAVSGSAYLAYIRCAGGLHWALVLLFGLIIAQGATVSSTIVLGFWTQGSISGFSNGDYMALYAGLGVGTAVLTFMAAIAFAQAGFTASLRLFGDALKGVMFTNVQWHEKTPTGAITNRLSKDIDTLDTSLPRNMMSLLQDVASICGTVALVFYSFAYLGLIFPPLAILYWFISAWYRRTNVEIRRIDAGLRTRLYASFTEALTGISTIRAHHAQNRFLRECEAKLDAENRASLIGRAAPVWLSLYMDVLSNLLVLGVGLFAVGFREKTNPAKMAVVLTYSLNLATIMMFTAQIYASVEADMNAVERIEVYARLPAESQDEEADGQHVEPSWPSEGSIRFDAVELRYGDHLPPAIKGLSFAIRPGERAAVVGRTGAGKSSILGALFRVTPALSKGHILVDGIDIKQVSRQRLRNGLAIIPQDTVLINGTLRSNIDPEGRAPDIELFAALKRVGLADPNGKFALDRQVDQDAFSAGEKQLLAICRAMVRTDARILVLDEATSNVDVATDALVQQLIREDFKDKTLLCIAHRLSTILYYDRVLVMHDGELAECDTPLALYDAGGLFRSMCEKASIRRDDIVRAGAF